MAVSSTLEKVTVNVQLNNGEVDGKVKTINTSLPKLSVDRYDDQKAVNIVNLYRSVASKPVFAVKKVETSSLKSA